MARCLPWLLLLVQLLVGGCTSSDGGVSSYKHDLELICDAHRRSGAAVARDPAQRGLEMARWITGNVKSPEAMQLFKAIAAASPSQKSELLRQAAAAEGVSPCAYADWFDANMANR